jgi:hypothetical protein
MAPAPTSKSCDFRPRKTRARFRKADASKQDQLRDVPKSLRPLAAFARSG